MEYFLLTQSKSVVNPIKLLVLDPAEFTPQMEHKEFAKLKKVSISYFYHTMENEIPDIIKYPTYMVSDPIKKILALYNEDVSFRAVQAFPMDSKEPERIQKLAKLYWIYDCVHVDCLSKDTVFLPNGEVEEIILDRNKLLPMNVFRPKGLLENRLIVSLPVAESIMRRNGYGVGIQPVQVR